MLQIKLKRNTILQLLLILLAVCLLQIIDLLRLDIDYFLFALSFLAILELYHKYPNFLIRYIMLFFMAIGNLTGVFICEHSNVWLPELSIYAGHTGSYPLIFCGWFLLIAVVWMLDIRFKPAILDQNYEICKFSIGSQSIKIYQLLAILCFIVALLSLINVAWRPAFLEHIDRFAYRERYITRPLEIMANFIYAMFPILFAMTMKKINRFWLYLNCLTVVFFSLYLFCTGEKFGGFWYIVVYLCVISSLFTQSLSVKELHIRIKKISGIFLVLLTVVAINQSLTYSLGGNRFVTVYFPQRIAQQGQLWWRTYALDKNNGMRINELGDETRVFFQPDDQKKLEYNHAIYKIMRFTTPADIFHRKILSGSRYSTSTFASMFYYFKRIGVILWGIIGGILFWGLMYLCMTSAGNLYVVESILASKLLVMSYAVLAMSELNILLQFKQIFYLLIVISMFVVRRYLHLRRSEL